jgi:2-polyprenyl-3-methyl-5-hydroxy-6-metoxy-1,4-benzoquinol methylase
MAGRISVKKDKKKVSRELGLEIGSICGRYFLKLNHLHYGYWTDGLEVDIANVHIAQENYAYFLISHIPENAKKILDVGCGTGQIAKKLIAKGCMVDCVSPSHFLAGQTRELLGNSSNIFECLYEQLQTENRYDVILFCESFQYIDMEEGIRKTLSLLNPDGCMLICDLFRKKILDKSDISGGHQLELFQNIVSEHPLRLIKDLDITEQTAPNIDVVNDMFKNAVHPTIILTQQLLENRYPFMSKFIKWLYRKKISKINRKYFNYEKTGEKFKKFKSYRLLLYKKSDSR